MLYMHLKAKNHGSLSLTSRVKNASGVDYTRQIPYHQMIYLMSGSSVHLLSQNPMEDTPTSRKEFNATFLCPECISHSTNSTPSPSVHKEGRRMHVGLIITISVVVSIIFIIGSVVAYKYWLKKRREQEQARFLELFEEDDDIEDELGLDM